MSNEITTTLRISEGKYNEFKEFAEDSSISLNSAFKTAASIGLKVLKGEFKNVAFLDNPQQISSKRTL